ncbi:MAG: hypothetical protein LBJ71_03860, partial [Holosporaceae bacterium]|nr:hypothetical protein [Holosporaceae bacterium]
MKIISIFFRYKRKSTAFILLLASALLIFFDGVDDETSVELYLQKMQELSIHHIDNTQKYLITTYYLQNKNRHPPKPHRRKIRREFSSMKQRLRQEWSLHYSLEWPRAVGYFQAHHVIPINAG